jgi:hypothetical protein
VVRVIEMHEHAGDFKEADSMKSQITGLRVASIVFGLIALAQLVRLAIRPEVLVGVI